MCSDGPVATECEVVRLVVVDDDRVVVGEAGL